MPSLHITNPETVSLAKRLADCTGESLTTAVTEALRERLARMRAIMDEMRKHWIDTRTREEIDDDMYDEWGLPK